MSGIERDKLVIEARVHLHFCMQLYKDQMARHRYFFHEHPSTDAGCNAAGAQEVMGMPGVMRLIGRESQCGMRSTGWMTNSLHVGREVAARCKQLDRAAQQEARRQHALRSGRASRAEIYPRKLALAIIRGVGNQIKADEGELGGWSIGATGHEDVMHEVDNIPQEERPEEEEDEWRDEMQHWAEEDYDANSGELLDPVLVQAAKKEELEYIDKLPLYDIVDVAMCWDRTGQKPVSTRWTILNKGDAESPEVRARRVARDFKTYMSDDFLLLHLRGS